MDRDGVATLKARGRAQWHADRLAADVQAFAVEGVPIIWHVVAADRRTWSTVRASTSRDAATRMFEQMHREGTAPAYALQVFDPRKATGWRCVALWERGQGGNAHALTTGDDVTCEF